MSTLKALRDRITTIRSTEKITQAMKLVAATKFRRAQEGVENGRHYTMGISTLLEEVLTNIYVQDRNQSILWGREDSHTHLIIGATSDRGLCGSFNTSIVREVTKLIQQMTNAGNKVKLLIIGQKGVNALSRTHNELFLDSYPSINPVSFSFKDVLGLTRFLIKLFHQHGFDKCHLVFNGFKSALKQEVVTHQLIPFISQKKDKPAAPVKIYEFEPNEEMALTHLFYNYIAAHIFLALLENQASEQGSRMVAMDNATRNAEEMIRKLNIEYNRTRQAHITQELMEIISGAEAL